MQSAINTPISLSGDDTVKRQLAEVGAAGERAAQQLAAAGAGASNSLAALSSVINSVAARFREGGNAATPLLDGITRLSGGSAALGPLGEIVETLTTGLGGVATATVGAVAGFAALSVAAAKSTIAAEAEARALGTTVERLEGLKFAAASVGVASDNVVQLLARFDAALGRSRQASEQQDAATAKTGASASGMGQAFAQAAQQIEAASTAFSHSQESIAGADQSVTALAHRLDQLKLAYRDVHNSAQTNSRLQQQIEAGASALATAEQRRQQAIEASQKAFERLQQTQADAAAKQRAEALTAASDNSKNILAGIASLDKGGTADVVSALGQFADRFNTMRDSAEQAALAMSVFGRGWREAVPLLALGSTGISNLSAEMHKLDVALPTEDEKRWASENYAAFYQLTTGLDRLKDVVGNIFGQYFAPMFKGVAEGLAANANAVRDFVSGFAGTVMPAVRAVSEAFSTAFGIIGDGFKLLSGAAKLFGADWSASSIAGVASATLLIAAIGRVSGAFRVLNLVMAVNPFVLISAALAAVTAAMFLLFGRTEELSNLIRKVFGDDAANSFDDFVKTFRGAMEPLIKWFEDSWLGRFLTGMEHAIARVAVLLDKLGLAVSPSGAPTSAGAAPAASADIPAPAGHAAGGMIRGPGSGTSDSILARLSNGEFVATARAVAHYGASFMHAINNLAVPRFEFGGLVMAQGPAFADGGLVASLAGASSAAPQQHVAVDLNYGGRIFPVLAPRDVADALVEQARNEQMRSGGKKPSWYSSGNN